MSSPALTLATTKYSALLVAACIGTVGGPIPFVAGELLDVKRNAGWCWFMDPRALVVGDRLLVGTVAGADGHGSDRGDIEISSLDLASRARQTFKLHPKLEGDDHDSPSILSLADGRLLTAYTKHAKDGLMRWRVSERPEDLTAWGGEQLFDTKAKGGVTYSNTFRLSTEPEVVYNFYRGHERNPHVMTFDVAGTRVERQGRLLRWDQTARSGARAEKLTGLSDRASPYLVYASNGVDTIHLAATEDHPRGYDNGIQHGYVRGGALHDSFGKVIDTDVFDDVAVSPLALTRVYEGDADNVAWTIGVALDAKGLPYLAFSVQKDGAAHRSEARKGGMDHRYFYGRFDGAKWHVHQLAFAGTRLYPREDDYTGLVALHPRDPNLVFLSTNADPATGRALASPTDGRRHYELYLGRTDDFGATWRYTPITARSTVDNLRPIVTVWKDHTVLVWLRGKYRSMNRYTQDAVALIDPERSLDDAPRVAD